MPVRNGEPYLRPAIDSVLAQSFANFELVVVNDGSTDGTASILKSYRDQRIRVITHDRPRGFSAALNHGLEHTTAAFVARQDADDLSSADRLGRQFAFMRAHPDVALLGSQAWAIDAVGSPLAPIDRGLEDASIRWYALFDNAFIHTSVMFRRDVVWDTLHGYDAEFAPASEDYELWGRVMRSHTVANLPERLVTYRVHGASMMGAIDGAAQDLAGRAPWRNVVRRLVGRHIEVMFGPDATTVAERDRMSAFVLGLPPADVAGFLDSFLKLLRLYGARHRGVLRSRDFRRTLARQIDAIAFRIEPPSRYGSARVYARLLRECPGAAAALSWPRAAATLILGRAGRAWLNRVRTAGLAPIR
jgi:hypothetical protein